ncbi:MAG TPA: hypothetical protein VIK89_04570 [Cytophagaceae bacterium]
MEELKQFKELFWDAFHRPRLITEKYTEIWQSLEPLNDYLAGPLFAIYEKGNCQYVFQDNERFPGISTSDDLLNWLVELVEEYKNGILQGTVENEDEKKDYQLLMYQTDIKMQLAELAYQITSNNKQ